MKVVNVGDGVEVNFLTDSLLKKGYQVLEVVIENGDSACGKQIMDLGLSADVIIGYILRGNSTILPNGRTEIREGDKLMVFTQRVPPEIVRSGLVEGFYL